MRYQTSLAVLLAALLGPACHSLASSQIMTPVGPVATKATCGKNDRTESGIQGQTPLADRFGPGHQTAAFNCNLELLSQTGEHGANTGLVTTDKCAYFTQWQAPELLPVLKNPGVVVVDVSDSARPKIARYLQSAGMLDAHESLVVHQRRGLLIGQAVDQTHRSGKTTDIYDISDCLNPVLKFSGVIPDFVLHTGDLTRDGKTLWAAPGRNESSKENEGYLVSALDISDPAHPKVIARLTSDDSRLARFHNISVSDDGNTVYFPIGGSIGNERRVEDMHPQGLVVADVSEVQARKPDAKIKPALEPVYWHDTFSSHYTYPVTVAGKRYLFQSDASGVLRYVVWSGGPTGRAFVGPLATRGRSGPPAFTAEQACSWGKPGWGYVHVFELNGSQPTSASAVKLAIQDPKHCLVAANEPFYDFGYSGYNCDFDNFQDAKLMACASFQAGLRVFDISNIKQPRELAYYKPPAVGVAPRAASPYQSFRDTGITTGATKYHSADGVTNVKFANNAREVWFVSWDNAFQVVKFSDELIAREKALFGRDNTCGGKLRDRKGCL
ncbi:hypothetical protein [Steroidobacter sp.]|uniref:hypothetical protein n=1 Tax=Steroidobacter sp. TaxID=1978227 RepID=UPI001A468213|nr:hypothetical protein [Steroidobacter sp.]MBL8270029.1 hypothetical protein [Steroidobacter sp.]